MDICNRTKQALVNAVTKGEWHNGGPSAWAAAAPHPLGAVQADIIRDILRGDPGRDLDPRGLMLRWARITGVLDLSHVQCIVGLRLKDCVLEERAQAEGAHIPWLRFTRTRLAGLMGDNLEVSDSAHFRQCDISDRTSEGLIRLRHCHVGGNLEFIDGTTMRNDTGQVLTADGLRVEGSLNMRHGFHAEGSSEDGLIDLHSAKIGGAVDIREAHVRNHAGAAVAAERIQVGGHMNFTDFTGEGHGQKAAVRVTSAQVDGCLNLKTARVRNLTGPAIDLRWTKTNMLILPTDAPCQPGGKDQQSRTADCTFRFDGLTYSALPDCLTTDERQRLLSLLRKNRAHAYAAQPYQQLADFYRTQGNEEDARTTLIAQQEDMPADQLGGWWARVWHLFLGKSIRYGYRSWRAIFGLIFVAIIAVLLGFMAGHDHAGPHQYLASRPSAAGQPSTQCSTTQQIALGLDLGIPFGKTIPTQQCQLNTSNVTGQILTMLGWVLQVLAWAAAALFVAGYTGLVRKT